LWHTAALCGVLGGFVVEGLELYRAIRARGTWPWRVKGQYQAGPVAYVVAETLRLAIGGVVAGVAAASDQVPTPLVAMAFGIAAPALVTHLTRTAPLHITPPPAASPPASRSAGAPAQQAVAEGVGGGESGAG
jgi:hypothetical protein